MGETSSTKIVDDDDVHGSTAVKCVGALEEKKKEPEEAEKYSIRSHNNSDCDAVPNEHEEEDETPAEAEATAKQAPMDALMIPPYASPLPPFMYWIETFFIAIQSVAFSLFALAYLNIVYEVPNLWLSIRPDGDDDVYPSDASTTTFLSGQPVWIGIGALTGLVVGIIKAYVFRFDSYDGFVVDLIDLGEGADPLETLKVTVTCLMSLMGGASVGPESGLGSACCGMSVLWARVVNHCCRWTASKFNNNEGHEAIADTTSREEYEQRQRQQREEDEKRRSKLMVLCGMVAAFAAILPTPASAILVCIELPGFETLSEKHGLPYIKTVTQLTFAGVISIWIWDYFKENTYLPSEHAMPGFLHKYESSDIPLAMAIGCMGAVLVLAYFLIGGIVKAIVGNAKPTLDAKFGKQCRVVTLCLVGGTLCGILGYVFPLTLGDGMVQLPIIIGKDGADISTAVLVSSGFAKMLAFFIANECGFVGGLFFPLVLISSIGGRVIVNELGTPWATTMACALVALPAAVAPVPFALMVLATSAFNLSSKGSIPVLVCIVTAHTLFVGLGIPQKLVPSGRKAEAERNTASKTNHTEVVETTLAV